MKAKEDFPISNYPLEQTEFYYAQKQARDTFADEKNKVFDYSMFHFRHDITQNSTDLTVRPLFDRFLPKGCFGLIVMCELHIKKLSLRTHSKILIGVRPVMSLTGEKYEATVKHFLSRIFL